MGSLLGRTAAFTTLGSGVKRIDENWNRSRRGSVRRSLVSQCNTVKCPSLAGPVEDRAYWRRNMVGIRGAGTNRSWLGRNGDEGGRGIRGGWKNGEGC